MSEEFNNVEEPVQEEQVQEDYTNPYATQEPQPIVEAPKSDLIAGLVGAVFGSLIGAALWVIIYKVGFIAGIAGAVTAVGAMKGYEKLGEFLDKKGVICSVLIAIVTIFLSNKIAWAWEIYDAFIEYDADITFFDAFINTDNVIAELDLVVDYYKDLLIGYALTVWACYKNVVDAFKSAN